MSAYRIAVMGAAGRMGRELVRTIAASEGCVVAGGTEPKGSKAIGEDIGQLAGLAPLGIKITDDALSVIANCDAIVDFTVPAATVENAGLAANARIVHVIGTTGLGETHEAAIKAAARHATIVKSGNMSLGVNLLAALTRKVAEALDEDFDIEVMEAHHRHKVDAPSGTALMLGEAAAAGRKISLKERGVRARDGITGARGRGDIGFAVMRGGNIVGEHSVIFAADGEIIELTHRATDRGIFARGAIKAAIWARGRKPGLYSMTDVLGM